MGAPALTRFACAAALALALAACATPGPQGGAAVRSELYFGLGKPDGGTVTEAEWTRFVETTVAREFPGGFTVATASGAWLPPGASRPVHEPSRILLVVHDGTPRNSAALERVRAAYRRQFQQQSVLRVDQPSRLIPD